MEEYVCINKNPSGSQYEFKIYTYGDILWAEPELIESRELFIPKAKWDEDQNKLAQKAKEENVPEIVKTERLKKKLVNAEKKLAKGKKVETKKEEVKKEEAPTKVEVKVESKK